MIIEDEQSSAERFASYVTSFGKCFEVTSICRHAESAFNEFRNSHPDVILTDIRMPGEDGLSLVSRLRQAGWQGELIVISGYDEFSYAQQAIRLGAAEFLLKPVFPEDMHRALSRLLGKVRSSEGDDIAGGIVGEKQDHLPQFVRQAIAYVATHYNGRISLREAAQYAFVSSAYLSSSFKPACGMTFVEYVTRFRIEVAKKLLIEGNTPLEEIAGKVGISDPAYFNKLFKKVELLTPGRYRKQHSVGSGTMK